MLWLPSSIYSWYQVKRTFAKKGTMLLDNNYLYLTNEHDTQKSVGYKIKRIDYQQDAFLILTLNDGQLARKVGFVRSSMSAPDWSRLNRCALNKIR
ncbi:hypothetical protein PALB_16230 [Pseudoalteromonas luteoviolacea B = ATCC 29581]|nr:hypothetical protein PALB_16230 [Pseudoalteromonas luteoviolacea B = ATCC 29581]